MLIRFYVAYESEDKPNGGKYKERVYQMALALRDGSKPFGDEVEIVHNGAFDGPHSDVDVACCWGIAGNSKEIVTRYVEVGKRALMFDKALIRRLNASRWGHYRVGMDGPDSLKYLMRKLRGFDRWEFHRVEMKPKQSLIGRRGTIVYAGSSQKYCDWYELGDSTEYAKRVFGEIRTFDGKSKFVYRPKPSWRGAEAIEGTVFSGGDEALMDLMRNAGVLITYGSAAAVEALVSGVPVITLGPCVARPVANLNLSDVKDLYFPPDEVRFHWLCNLAYCQWTSEELRSGEAWGFLRNELKETRKKEF